MPPKLFLDPNEFDLARPDYDLEAIRARNPHRFEMEQLTGVLRVDPERQLVAGFRRYGPEEFWARGHIPGRPLLPGVLMIEAAAQLGTFYAKVAHPEKQGFWGLAAVDGVKFRGAVAPGETLVIVDLMREVRARLLRFDFQGTVGEKLIVEGTITGMLF
jgi:3-hydroxyacyl-[acyl-carrier-protein] dehydratase